MIAEELEGRCREAESNHRHGEFRQSQCGWVFLREISVFDKRVFSDIIGHAEDEGMIEHYIVDYLIRMGFVFAGVIAIAFLISKAFEEE